MENSKKEPIDRVKTWFNESISLKITFIGILIFLLMIPNSMIRQLIFERQSLKLEAQREISEKWGNPQTFTGPYLIIPFFEEVMEVQNGEKTLTQIEHQLHILPENLEINGELIPEIRKRGIYKAILYHSRLKVTGNFVKPDLKKFDIDPDKINWEKAVINIGITDMSGIEDPITVEWGDKTVPMSPGASAKTFITSGVSGITELNKDTESISFSFDINLQGSENIHFAPLGKITNVKLKSTWDSPSFQGKFLPDNHEITDDGFMAEWQILDMNRNFPQEWVDDSFAPISHNTTNQYNKKNYGMRSSLFGVQLLETVDEYQKNTRSAKYAILIIAFTFIMYFFFEIISKSRIHPFQYTLIGFAILLFYVLLLSLSEHIGFNWAYLSSAGAIILMIMIYSSAILKSRKHLGVLFSVMILIYGFIFIILQLEDFALLAGSIGLFIALFATMYFSRNINWYNIRDNQKR